MSFRTTALLFGILMGLFWVFGLLMTLQKRKLDPGFILPTLARDATVKIDTVEVERSGKKYVFARTGAGWKLTIPPYSEQVRADDKKVEEIIKQVSKARKTEEADLTRNLAQWGLDAPTVKVTLKKDDETPWTLNVGRESADKNYLYVNSSDRPREVLAVRRRQLDSVLIDSSNIHAYRSQQLLDASDTDTQFIKLKMPADPKAPLLVLEKGKGNAWRFATPAYGPADYEGGKDSAVPTGVRGLLNTIGSIRVASDKDFEPLGKEIVEEGKEMLRVEVEHTAASVKKGAPARQVLLIGTKVEGKDQYYARLETDKRAAARVAARDVDILLNFLKHPEALRSHELAQLDAGAVDAIRVRQGKELAEVVTLAREGDRWEVAAGAFRHQANGEAVQGKEGLLAALQGKSAVKNFWDVQHETKEGAAKDKEMGLDHPTVKIEVWTDGLKKDEKKKEKKEETKDGKKEAPKEKNKEEKKDVKEGPRINPNSTPVVTLTFGKITGENVYVKRQTPGGVSRVSVPKSVLEKVAPPQGALAYLDTNITPFRDIEIAKLELKLPGGRKFVVERGKEADAAKWLLLEPKIADRPYADSKQVAAALAALAKVTAREWVKKVEPKADLTSFGLKEPLVTAAVTLKPKGAKDAPVAYVYQFGTVTKQDKGPGVFGLIASGLDLKDIVFVTDANSVDVLKDVELRDRTVFKFNPDKVHEVRLTIVTPSATLYPVFKRDAKDKTWKYDSKEVKVTLNSERVDKLLEELSDLKAERFIAFTGAKDKQYELGEKAKLKIELVVDGSKSPHTLTVGAADGAKSYYAQSSDLPTAVFTVSQARFGPILTKGLNYFAEK